MLNQSIRNKIYKIPLLYKLCRLAVDIINKLYYILQDNRRKLVSLKKSKKVKNKRCFIIGNGPSLKSEDLDMLVNEDCFAMNYIFKIFDKTKWRPTYYLAQDAYGVPFELIKEAELNNIMLGSYYCRKKGFTDNSYCYYNRYAPFSKKIRFSSNAQKEVFDSNTVTYSAIQIAVYLGYQEIYLLGMDTDFSMIIDTDGNLVYKGDKSNHFYEDSSQKNIIYNETAILKGYMTTREYCDKHNVKIFNATRGGKLEIFERIDFDTLVKNKTEVEK